MSRNLRAALAGVGLAAIALAALAQPPKPLDAPVVRGGKPGETTLFMLVRTGPHLTPDNLATTLDEGLSASGCKIDGKPAVRSVSPAVFEEIDAIANPGAATPEAVKAAGGLKRITSSDNVWQFKLNSPSQVLKKLTIKYRKADGKDYDKEYQPASPQADAPLVLLAPGVYALRPESADQAVSYEAEVVSLGEAPQKMEGKWPASDRFYVITMRNFRGDRDTLFATLQDEKKVANPLDSIRLGNDLVFVFANLEASGAESGGIIVGNNLVISLEPPRRRSVARGWFLFPLDENGMKEQLDAYRKITDAKEAISKVRENSVAAKDAFEISPGTTAKWLELPAMNGQYRREIPMTDFKGLLEKYPTAFGLIVWEFENEQGMRSAIQLRLPGGGLSMVREQELLNWANSLKQKVDAPK
jgi:hypothetical protein